MKNKIEVPFGAHDSELCGFEYTIPEGMEAEIKDGKVVIRKKESEDERIRKELLSFIESVQHSYLRATDRREKWISYLEKQKEPKPGTIKDNPINPFDTKLFQDGVKEGRRLEREDMRKELSVDEYANVLADEEVQGLSVGGENIPAIKELIRRAFRFGVMRQKYIDGNSEKPNTQWSKEDEEKLDWCINLVISQDSLSSEWKNEVLDWLNSLRPQSKKELAKMLQDKYNKGYKDAEEYHYMVEVPYWKPSEEQLGTLKFVIGNHIFGHQEHQGILESLYNDLKKL